MPCSRHLIACIALLLICTVPATVSAWQSNAQSLSSLQSYTGILQMPNARVKPDWTAKLKIGYAEPYIYYGGALGLFDRIEFHGQFTEVNTITGFPGYDYGDYKDRSAGMRLVLIDEKEFFPQIAAGFFDATGTGKFSNRYIVASKMFGNCDFTLGAGQGTLAGEYTGRGNDSGESFFTSDPFRKTRVFGGLEWHINKKLTLSAEYSSFDWSNMFGYRDGSVAVIKEDESSFDINIGAKYKISDYLYATVGFLKGNTFAGGVNFTFPLEPEGPLPWKKTKLFFPGEKLKWNAYTSNTQLSKLVSQEIQKQGYINIAVSCSDSAVWIEYENNQHLSNARSIGHVASVCDKVLPDRIQTFYLNIKQGITILQSLKTSRQAFNSFMDNKLDREGFLAYSDIHLYKDENWNNFKQDTTSSELYHPKSKRFSYNITPKVETFLNNKTGFFKHKGYIRGRAGYKLWHGADLLGELEWTVFNEFDDIDYEAFEKEKSVRTDLLDYEAESTIRISMLALEQKVDLPYSIQGRASAGIFESAYMGFGFETFRYFNDGIWGAGFESEWVRKRDPDDNFKLRDDPDNWYSTAFLNLYSQILPSQGLDAGLKIGQFLAGDFGIRIDLRRSFKHFTIGAWYTKTDTSIFESEKNRDTDQKGVYISFPLSIFQSNDKPGHLTYGISSFTRDPGSQVRQPDSLYPLNPWSTPDHTKRTLNEMRKY